MPRPPLLFLHGIRGSALVRKRTGGETLLWNLEQEFRPGAEALALRICANGRALPRERGVRIGAGPVEDSLYGPFLEDRRGKSRLIAPCWDWRLAPEQALEAIRGELQVLDRVDVVCHSMGSQILLEALACGLLRPEQLERIVFVTPPFCGSLDIVSLLRDGRDCGGSEDEAERQYDSALARSFPALYHLLPGPGCPPPLGDWLRKQAWPRDFPPSHAERLQFQLLLAQARRAMLRRRKALWQLFRSHPRQALILAGSGVPTISSVEGAPRTSLKGDGRLLVSVTRPPSCPWPRRILGSPQRPMPHGEFLATDRGVAACCAFLDSESLA